MDEFKLLINGAFVLEEEESVDKGDIVVVDEETDDGDVDDDDEDEDGAT